MLPSADVLLHFHASKSTVCLKERLSESARKKEKRIFDKTRNEKKFIAVSFAHLGMYFILAIEHSLLRFYPCCSYFTNVPCFIVFEVKDECSVKNTLEMRFRSLH